MTAYNYCRKVDEAEKNVHCDKKCNYCIGYIQAQNKIVKETFKP